MGEILVRAHSVRRPDDELPVFRDSFDASQVPHLAAIGARWHVLAKRDTCPRALRAFVDGLLAQATAPPHPRDSA